jgi:hypothetical protein
MGAEGSVSGHGFSRALMNWNGYFLTLLDAPKLQLRPTAAKLR